MVDPTEISAARHESLLQAAFGVFLRYGYKKTSMDDLARAAGLSRQGLYLHFANKDALFNDPDSPVAGNPMGDVTVVEFFDYHCPYCKAVAAPLNQLIQEDKGVRLVLKEFPILGEDSILASHAALASVGQGKYWAFHQALMEHRGKFDMDVIKSIATKVGIDPVKLEADMGQQQIEPMISANHTLARTLDLNATPTFIIGDQVIEGAVPLERLKEIIKQVRGS